MQGRKVSCENSISFVATNFLAGPKGEQLINPTFPSLTHSGRYLPLPTSSCHNFRTAWWIFKLQKSKLLKISPGIQIFVIECHCCQNDSTLLYTTLTWKCHNFRTTWWIFKLKRSKLLKILPGIQILLIECHCCQQDSTTLLYLTLLYTTLTWKCHNFRTSQWIFKLQKIKLL